MRERRLVNNYIYRTKTSYGQQDVGISAIASIGTTLISKLSSSRARLGKESEDAGTFLAGGIREDGIHNWEWGI